MVYVHSPDSTVDYAGRCNCNCPSLIRCYRDGDYQVLGKYEDREYIRLVYNCLSLISCYRDSDLPITEEVRTQIQNRPATNHLAAFIAACTVADGVPVTYQRKPVSYTTNG